MNGLSPELLEVMRTEIAFAVKVNAESTDGKIDSLTVKIDEHNVKHEADMKRMMPIIEKYETGQRDVETALKAGRGALWIAGTITAIGGAFLILRAIFAGH